MSSKALKHLLQSSTAWAEVSPKAQFDLPFDPEDAPLLRKTTTDLAAAQHNLRKAFTPAK